MCVVNISRHFTEDVFKEDFPWFGPFEARGPELQGISSIAILRYSWQSGITGTRLLRQIGDIRSQCLDDGQQVQWGREGWRVICFVT